MIGVFFPINFAKLFESTGSTRASFYFYEKAYHKSTDINNIYTLVNKAIDFKIDKKVVQYYEKLSSHDRYGEFIDFINEHNYSQDSSVLVNSMLTNEDNRLKTRYVTSLANIDLDKAFKYAIDDLFATSITSDNNPNINFVLAGLYEYINADNIKYFEATAYAKDNTLVADKIMQTYLDLSQEYERIKAELPNANYLLAVYSGKLVDMCQTMILIDKYVDHTKLSTTYNTDDLKTALTSLVNQHKNFCR